MGLRNARILILSSGAVAVLSACSSFSIDQPKDGAVVRLPANNVHVVVTGKPSMSGVSLMLDQTSITNQIHYVTDSSWEGDVAIPAGSHTITAAAKVPCWYCSPNPWQASSQIKVCSAAATWPAGTPTQTAFGMSNNLSWVKTSDSTIGVATDTGTSTSQWHLIRTGGISQSIGLIQSTENSCLCMRSIDDKQSTPIGLAICDSGDSTQVWQALPIQNTGGNFRLQNTGRGLSDACLTQANAQLIQKSCLDTGDQLWKIKDNSLGQFVSPF